MPCNSKGLPRSIRSRYDRRNNPAGQTAGTIREDAMPALLRFVAIASTALGDCPLPASAQHSQAAPSAWSCPMPRAAPATSWRACSPTGSRCRSGSRSWWRTARARAARSDRRRSHRRRRTGIRFWSARPARWRSTSTGQGPRLRSGDGPAAGRARDRRAARAGGARQGVLFHRRRDDRRRRRRAGSSFASAGAATPGHFAGEVLKLRTKAT